MASDASSWLLGTSAAMLAVKATSLPRSLLRFPPSPIPTALPPPSNQPTLAHPFTIPTNVYNALLSPTVPITFALIYTSVVSYLNNVNAQRQHKPWPTSQTRAFKAFVLIHNAILAAYSAWTFIGMVNALMLSFASWNGDDGVAGVVDSLCKMNGPRGLGSAATYNETSSAWQITNRAFHLAADGLGPESTDVGRMWNEGLAFYGWLFYLSKFYEVIDTAIILAKGKRSSFLQAYHHAGAMLCMWAGIRYMSPPIWMFVLVNSGIHAIMYTFYFCTALGVRVPKRLKQILTTMQISQFVIGATYAFAHLFVAYRIPVSVPYIYHLGSAVSSAASAASSGASSVGSSAIATASAGAWLKKLALRAAGREALAENVPNDRGQRFGIDAVNVVQDFTSREETRYRDELQWTHCLDTSGQVFAILLNCMYLAPLTWLFVRFFVTAYSKRLERRRSSTPSDKAQVAGQGLQDASKGLARQVSDVLDQMHGGGEDDGGPASPGEGVQVNGESIKKTAEDLKNAVQDRMGEGVEKAKQLKDELGGGINPIAYMQNKNAESRQRKSTTPSDAAEEHATESTTHEKQSPGDGISAADAGEPQKGYGVDEDADKSRARASEKTRMTESSSEESGKEESVTPNPNQDGTGVEEATDAAKTTDSQQKTADETNEKGKEKDNAQEGPDSGADGQPTASSKESGQAGSEADILAKDTALESEGDDLESQEVPDTQTSDFEHVEKPQDESGDDQGSESEEKLTKESAEIPPKQTVDEGEAKSQELPAVPAQGAEEESKGTNENETGGDTATEKSRDVAEDGPAENAATVDGKPSKDDAASEAQQEDGAGDDSGDEQISFIEPEKALAELPKVQPEDAPGAPREPAETTLTEASELKPAVQSEEQEKRSITPQQTDETAEDEKPSISKGRTTDSEKDNVEALPTHVDEDAKKEHEELTRSPSTKSKTSSIKSRTSSIRSKASSIRSRFRRSSQSLDLKHEEGSKDKENQTAGQAEVQGKEKTPRKTREAASYSETVKE